MFSRAGQMPLAGAETINLAASPTGCVEIACFPEGSCGAGLDGISCKRGNRMTGQTVADSGQSQPQQGLISMDSHQ